jgi:hypothetical protein
MLNIKKLITILGVASMTAACGTTTGTDGDATDGTGSDATVGEDSMGDMAMGDTTMPVVYKSVVIWDKSQDPGFVGGKCGTSPGTDLDCVGLYRGGKLIGVGKPGTASFVAPATASPCTVTPNKGTASAAAGPLDGRVFAGNPVRRLHDRHDDQGLRRRGRPRRRHGRRPGRRLGSGHQLQGWRQR